MDLPSSPRNSHLCIILEGKGGKLQGAAQQDTLRPKAGSWSPHPYAGGPVKAGGVSMWQNVWLPDLTSGHQHISKVPAAVCQFLHQPTGPEAAMPCTACWLTTVMRHQPFPLPNRRNPGLANGNSDKHSLRTAVGGVPETSDCPPKTICPLPLLL